MPGYNLHFDKGEFIYNDFEGKKVEFVPFELDLHAPSPHTIDGK